MRERSFPSSNSMKTSCASFGYSGNCGVISNSVISGKGQLLLHLAPLGQVILDFLFHRCCLAVTARNNTISGRAEDSNCQVRDGVAASLPISRLASCLA